MKCNPAKIDVILIATLTIIMSFTVFYYFLVENPGSDPVPSAKTSTEKQVEFAEESDWILKIPAIKTEAPIILNVDGTNENEYYKALESGVAHMKNTAMPGKGNTVIFGHSSYYPWKPGDYKTIFENLTHIQNNDDIFIESNQNFLKYKVIKKEVVSPKMVEVVNPTEHSQITLITCWPLGTTNERLVITAKEEAQ